MAKWRLKKTKNDGVIAFLIGNSTQLKISRTNSLLHPILDTKRISNIFPTLIFQLSPYNSWVTASRNITILQSVRTFFLLPNNL